MKFYYHFSQIYRKNNWIELWYSCSNLITSASIEAKSNKRKKKLITQSIIQKKKVRIFVFLFYQNDICILEKARSMPIYISYYIMQFSNL